MGVERMKCQTGQDTGIKPKKTFKTGLLVSSTTLLLAMGLAGCGLDGVKSAMGGVQDAVGLSTDREAGSEASSSETTTSIASTRMPNPTIESDVPETNVADSDSDVKGPGHESSTLMGKKSTNERIYRKSEGWEILEYPPYVMPGGRFVVESADGSRSQCSFGWWVYNQDEPSRHYVTSAGHCGEKGDQVYIQDNSGRYQKVGEFVWSAFDTENRSSPIDHALIELTVSPQSVEGTPAVQNLKLVGWASASWLEEAQPRICRLGYRSGLSCGSYRGMVENYMFSYDNISDHGDSGGAIWAVSPDNPREVYAVGMASYGFEEDATSAGASLLAPIMGEFDMTIVE